MAQPIAFQASSYKVSNEEARLRTAPAEHAAALLSSYDLLQLLHDRGVLDLLRGLVGAGDELSNMISAALNTPECIRGIRNFLLLTKFFAGMPPEVLESLSQAVAAGSAREKAHKAPSMWQLLRRLRHEDSRHALSVTLDLLEGVGKAL